MQIKVKPMGAYATNCYILNLGEKEIIIDPGVDALAWIKQNVKNPVAIFNTHGHFDHVWSNKAVSEFYDIPIYCPKDDAFMLEEDPLGYGVPPSKPSFLVEPDEELEVAGEKFKFWHFPGHTPGCSMIEYEDTLFSGDFLFEGSIGRWDFPSSNKEDMIKSLEKVKSFTNKDHMVLPGHGASTSLAKELKNIDNWISIVKRS